MLPHRGQGKVQHTVVLGRDEGLQGTPDIAARRPAEPNVEGTIREHDGSVRRGLDQEVGRGEREGQEAVLRCAGWG